MDLREASRPSSFFQVFFPEPLGWRDLLDKSTRMPEGSRTMKRFCPQGSVARP